MASCSHFTVSSSFRRFPSIRPPPLLPLLQVPLSFRSLIVGPLSCSVHSKRQISATSSVFTAKASMSEQVFDSEEELSVSLAKYVTRGMLLPWCYLVVLLLNPSENWWSHRT